MKLITLFLTALALCMTTAKADTVSIAAPVSVKATSASLHGHPRVSYHREVGPASEVGLSVANGLFEITANHRVGKASATNIPYAGIAGRLDGTYGLQAGLLHKVSGNTGVFAEVQYRTDSGPMGGRLGTIAGLRCRL